MIRCFLSCLQKVSKGSHPHGSNFTKSCPAGGSVADKFVELVTAKRKPATATTNSLIDAMTLTLLMFELLRVFRIPVALELVVCNHTVAVKTVAVRWTEVLYTTLLPVMSTLRLASSLWGHALWCRSLHITKERVDRDSETKCGRTLLITIHDRAASFV